MQTPPPFQSNYAPPVKKSNPWTIVAIVFGVLGVCCILPIGAVAGLGFWGFNAVKGTAGCFIAAQTLNKALSAYEKAHGGKLPPAATWQDELRPYVEKALPKSKDMPFELLDPAGQWTCKNEKTPTGFTFNKEVGGKKAADIKDPSKTAVIFETTSIAKNQNGPFVKGVFKESPGVFGKHRGWIVLTADSEIAVIDKTGNLSHRASSSFSVDVSDEPTKKSADNESEQ